MKILLVNKYFHPCSGPEKILFLLNNPKEVERVGKNAKKAVGERFNVRSFVSAIRDYVKEGSY